MKKHIITLITAVALIATMIFPSHGDMWDPGGGAMPGRASVFFADSDGEIADGDQASRKDQLDNGYLNIRTELYIKGENGVKHNGEEILEVKGYNDSTLDNIGSVEMLSGGSWIDVKNDIYNVAREFSQVDHITNSYRLKINGNVQFSIQYKARIDDNPVVYYESVIKYVVINDNAVTFTLHESEVSTASPTTTTTASTTTTNTTSAQTSTTSTTTVAPSSESTSVEPSTEIESTGDITTEATTKYQPAKAPGKATIKKVWKKKRAAKKLKIKLKSVKDAKGYQVLVYKNKKNAKKHIKPIVTKYTTKTKYTIKSKKLKKKKKLFVGARAYNISSNGQKVFGGWAKIKKVKIK